MGEKDLTGKRGLPPGEIRITKAGDGKRIVGPATRDVLVKGQERNPRTGEMVPMYYLGFGVDPTRDVDILGPRLTEPTYVSPDPNAVLVCLDHDWPYWDGEED